MKGMRCVAISDDGKIIIAAFQTREAASRVGDGLKEELGVDEVQIEAISKYPGEAGTGNKEQDISGAGLSNLVFDADLDTNSGVLAGADPSVSGMRDGAEERVGTNIVLTAVVPKERGQEAEKIIRDGGGTF